jgi:flagellar basal body-associated protein FliL
MDSVKGGLSTYAKFRTYSGVIVMVIVALCFIVFGIFLVTRKDTKTANTSGTIKTQSCTTDKPPVCSGTIEYSVNGQTYTINGTWGTGRSVGQSENVRYDPGKPADGANGMSDQKGGWLFLVCGLILMLVAYLIYMFFSSLSNNAKAVVGGVEAASDVMGLISKN